MTLLVVIYGVANMALGYGLAVYLGHARGRAATTVRAARSQQAREQSPVEVTYEFPSTAAASPEPVVERVVEPVAPKPVVATAPPKAAEAEASAPATPPPVVENTPVPPATPVAESMPVAESVPVEEPVASEEAALEEEVLSKIEEVRAEIHDMPATAAEPAAMPATMMESLASTPESASDEESTANPVSKEALLESINAFQAQLKKQQELAKLHAVTAKSE